MFRTVALLGDPYARKSLRERLGGAFTRVTHWSAGGAGGSCELAWATVGERCFLDLGSEWEEAPAAVRTSALAALGADVVVVGYTAGATGVAHALTEARRAGIRDGIGVLRTGTHTPREADDEESRKAEQTFAAYAPFAGVTVRALLRDEAGIEARLEAALADDGPVALPTSPPEPPEPAERLTLACAICGAPVTSPVHVEPWEPWGPRWEAAPHDRDESIAPPGHAIRGDGVTRARGHWVLRDDVVYVHEADLLVAEDNGKGIPITCCGARPDPSNGPNLECPAGHPIGELWTDCCAPQGGHLDAARVVVR